jgi:SAM-dependent methyltransferase
MMISDTSARLDQHAGWRGRLFAFCMAWAGHKHDSLLAQRKRELFAGLSGTVLEIGPGTGANLAYFPRDIRWIGIEPNPHMHGYLRKRAASLGLEIDIHSGLAEQIDLPPESVDAVISTLVLCSVHDLAGVLREVHRVLKPGGRFIFLEHVAAPQGTWLRLIQRLVRPLWRAASAGCQPDRDIAASLLQGGFERIDIDCFRIPAPVVSPHIAGVAVKAL